MPRCVYCCNIRRTFGHLFRTLSGIRVGGADPLGAPTCDLSNFTKKNKQEWIPARCVLPALYHTGGHCLWGLCLGGPLSRGVSVRETPQDRDPSPVDRMTDASKSITLAQTSFAGGKKQHAPGRPLGQPMRMAAKNYVIIQVILMRQSQGPTQVLRNLLAE